MSKSVASLNNGTLQGIIFKKCDRSNCKPSNKACSAGTCQHTCEPSAVDRCSHKWTLRYSANGRQSEKSYATLALAKDARLKLNTTKREQGRTFVDPKLADEMFLANAEQFIRTSSRLRANDKTRHDYLGKLRTTIAPVFGNRTLAQMATEQAAEDVAAFLNVTLAGKNVVYRQHARMIIVWTMDAAVKAGKVASHKLIGITLADGTHVTRRAQRAMDDDDESGTGFVFITDDQVAQLADGMTATRPTKTGKARTVVLQGVGLAAWLQRTMGLRIREALGVEKSDFKVRRDGSVILKLRSQASVDGKTRVPLKHRRAGEGREIPVPPMVWAMVEDLPDGPLCPGTATPTCLTARHSADLGPSWMLWASRGTPLTRSATSSPPSPLTTWGFRTSRFSPRC